MLSLRAGSSGAPWPDPDPGAGADGSFPGFSKPEISDALHRLSEEMPLLQLPDSTGELESSPDEWYSTGEGVKDCPGPFNGDRPAGEGETGAVCLAGEAVSAGRGGTGGERSRPLSAMLLASFPLSRLQLLGVGFTAFSGVDRFGSLRGMAPSPM